VANEADPTDSRLRPSTDEQIINEVPPPLRDIYTIEIPLMKHNNNIPVKMSVLEIIELLKDILPNVVCNTI
jgi:hypothetical protein